LADKGFLKYNDEDGISDRAYVLEQGYVVNSGNAKQLLDNQSV